MAALDITGWSLEFSLLPEAAVTWLSFANGSLKSPKWTNQQTLFKAIFSFSSFNIVSRIANTSGRDVPPFNRAVKSDAIL